MELVYLWVEEYKNIQNQGFNFLPKFNYKYDKETKELTPNNYHDYIENFFDEKGKINVTAIVGKNGSGKSSVIECLHSICCERVNINFNYILVFKKNEINYTSNIEISTDIIKKDITQVQCHIYSNDLIEYKNRINIKKENILENLLSNSLNEDFKLTTFMYIPQYIEIENIDIDNKFRELLNYDYTDYTYNTDVNDAENRRTMYGEEDERNNLIQDVDNNYHKFLIILFLSEAGFDNMFDLNTVDALKTKLEESDIDYLDENDFNIYFNGYNQRKIISELTEIEQKNYLNYSYLFKFDFIDNKKIGYNNLSHGERTIFGQFLSIYYLSIKEYLDNYLFLLDEAELSLHPNWQKNYLNELINLLKQIDKKFYIILSSHSPFLLSDIPKQNIIFLDTYDSESNEKYPNLNLNDLTEGKCINVSSEIDIKPFGANIHELLSHGFFMEDGLMGEFAKNKINKIIKFLNGDNKFIDFPIEQIIKVIESIGEDLLRMKLLDMYYEKFENDELEREKKQLLKQQKEINKRIKSIEDKQK